MNPHAAELSFQATQVARFAPTHGEPEWLLRFEPLHDASADTAQGLALSAICIGGVLPAAVRWVQVSCLEQTVFEIDSHLGRTGHSSAAGEIVQAVASMNGRRGMCIGGADCRPELTLRGAAVRLRLRGASAQGLVVRGLLA